MKVAEHIGGIVLFGICFMIAMNIIVEIIGWFGG